MDGASSLGGLFAASAARSPTAAALDVDGVVATYGELSLSARRMAKAVDDAEHGDAVGVAVLAARSREAYAGVLGALLAGRAYVPLNPEFPSARLAAMIEGARARVVVVAMEGVSALRELPPALRTRLTAIVSDEVLRVHDGLRELGLEAVIAWEALEPLEHARAPVSPTAYVMFTSGTTGKPKGVPISHDNALAYVTGALVRHEMRAEDRASQTFDLTFDLSVHDMFVTWAAGACLCVLPRRSVMGPAKLIRDKALTVWFSVPSVAMFMSRLGQLKSGALPSLRCSLFCGEPLPAAIAAQWQAAAPGSVVENLYGPTEATIAISSFRWHADAERQCVNGIVPIGTMFDGQRALVVDERLQALPAGESGELCLSGSQVADGYLDAPEKTAAQFVEIAGARYYRTGDRVRLVGDCLVYLSRIDDQIQILGHRVELQEVDHALREASGTSMAISVPVALSAGRADGLVGFVAGSSQTPAAMLDACRARLPAYMVPSRIVVRDQLPLNANGKIDRKALAAELDKPA